MPLKWIRSAAKPGVCLGRAAERNGLGYQRGKIQEESLHYEHLMHTGEYPIIGVSTFRNPTAITCPNT
jgi:methylmalonyl-CoA mutase N-terminal domain/subunit